MKIVILIAQRVSTRLQETIKLKTEWSMSPSPLLHPDQLQGLQPPSSVFCPKAEIRVKGKR